MPKVVGSWHKGQGTQVLHTHTCSHILTLTHTHLCRNAQPAKASPNHRAQRGKLLDRGGSRLSCCSGQAMQAGECGRANSLLSPSKQLALLLRCPGSAISPESFPRRELETGLPYPRKNRLVFFSSTGGRAQAGELGCWGHAEAGTNPGCEGVLGILPHPNPFGLC